MCFAKTIYRKDDEDKLDNIGFHAVFILYYQLSKWIGESIFSADKPSCLIGSFQDAGGL